MLHTHEVGGSSPPPPTIRSKWGPFGLRAVVDLPSSTDPAPLNESPLRLAELPCRQPFRLCEPVAREDDPSVMPAGNLLDFKPHQQDNTAAHHRGTDIHSQEHIT